MKRPAIELLVQRCGLWFEALDVVAGSIFKLDTALEGRRNLERNRVLGCKQTSVNLSAPSGNPAAGAASSSIQTQLGLSSIGRLVES